MSVSIVDCFPSRFLKAADIEDGERVTIKTVSIEAVGQDQVEKPVIAFKQHSKPAVLNRTNADAIRREFGDDYTAWGGELVILSKIRVRNPNGGGYVDSVAMEPVRARQAVKPAKPMSEELNDEIPDFTA
jgi:hypothetical protein